MANVCVIGAGINGLSAATQLQQWFNDAKITIIADSVSPNTTSDVAAGFWYPYLLGDPRKELISRWGKETFSLLDRMYKNGDEKVTMVSGYIFEDNPQDSSAWDDIVYNFRRLNSEDISNLGYPQYKYGCFFTSYSLNVSAYLEVLTKRFQEKGGKLIKKKLNSLEDLPEDFDIIVNCSGLSSRILFNDQSVYPIRGQVMRVSSSSVKHFFIFGGEYYCLPSGGSIVLGGTHEENDWDQNIRNEVANRILNGCQRLLPQLKNARVEKHLAGLRPARPCIRVEAETVTVHGKKIPVVHNYGHGGSGITLFYGCCRDTVSLVDKALNDG